MCEMRFCCKYLFMQIQVYKHTARFNEYIHGVQAFKVDESILFQNSDIVPLKMSKYRKLL